MRHFYFPLLPCMQVCRQKLLGAQNWDLLLDNASCKRLEEFYMLMLHLSWIWTLQSPGRGFCGAEQLPGWDRQWWCFWHPWVVICFPVGCVDVWNDPLGAASLHCSLKEVMMAQLSCIHCCCRCWGCCDGIFQIRDRRQKTVTAGHLNNTELERTVRFLKIQEDGWALLSSSAHPNCSLVFLLLCNVVSLCPTLRMHLTAICSCQILQLSRAVFIKDKPEGVVLVGSKGQAVVG